MEELKEQLKKFGLHKSESAIYLYLLEQGIATPPQIAKATGIARTNTYNTLQNLKAKGLVKEQLKGKRKAYVVQDPKALVRNIESKKEAIEKVLPDLRALYKTQKNKPTILFFEGFEEVKQIFRMSYQQNQEKKIYGLASLSHLVKLKGSEKFFKFWRAQLKKRKIHIYDIVTSESSQLIQVSKKELKVLMESFVLANKYQDLPTDILVWDDYVALIVTSEPVFGTLLHSPPMAATFKIMHHIIRESLSTD